MLDQRFNSVLFGLVALSFVVGLALRLGNPWDWAFINDELSTWHKVSYASLGEVIQNIKTVDSHPVGMYVGVYFWTAIFGTSEWSIKFPFFLMSLASMGLVYQLGRLWFSRSVGVLVLACWATLQFPIWWSHIARQYQSGSFLTLAMVYCWTQLVVYRRSGKRYWVGWVILGALACYNHYFSALFAGVVGLTGLFLIDFQRLWKYLLSGIVMLGLFVPHLPITLYQAQHADGHLWYGVPTPAFFSQHVQYLTHYSPWVMGVMGILALFGGILTLVQGKITQPSVRASSVWTLRAVAAVWFVAPAALGYWYSVTYSPILRPSHLLFSFPYGLLLLFSGWTQTEHKMGLSLAVCLLLGINTWTLVEDRCHFKVAHTHPYEHFVINTQAFLDNHDSDQVTIVLGENPDYLQYYKEAYQTNFNHYRSFKPDITFPKFKQLLERADAAPYLIVGSLPPAHIQCALEHYPHIIKYKEGVNYEYYILAKQPEEGAWTINYHCGETIPEQPSYQTYWTIEPYHWQTDSLGERYYEWEEEWGPTYDGELEGLLPQGKQSILEVHATVRSGVDSIPLDGTLVVEILTEQDSSLLWRGVNVTEQSTRADGWQDLYLSLRLVHEPVYRYEAPSNIRVFFWNREKQVVQLARFDICTRRDNPFLYKDTQPF